MDGTPFDFRRPRPIGSTKLDNAFTDLERDDDGLARVHLRDPHGGRSLALWVDDSYPYLMLFTGDPLPDVARRSLAVEPHDMPTGRVPVCRGAHPSGARTSSHTGIRPV